IIIDDFLIMNTSGYEFGNWRLDQQDKGHKTEISNIINFNLELGLPLLSVTDALRSMELCFNIIESIKNKKIISIKTSFYE
ncbi:MAG: hypothetical protein ACFFHV_07835, partial [Promethearchaeota archaeon]